MQTRYLTKSRFKLAMECPTKLFYTGKKSYANNKIEDPFLEALAQGGFQVGELAKAYYPGGHDIVTLDMKKALEETNEQLKQENCIIYEAAIQYENLFIRVDILEKQGNNINVIEVKSKSADKPTDQLFKKNNGGLYAEWKPYVYDIAFQNYVTQKAFPDYTITPYLMLVDTHAICPTDGLHQKFTIMKDARGRSYATLSEELTDEDLSEQMLVAINTEDICHKVIYEDTYPYQDEHISFAHLIQEFADHYQADQRIDTEIHAGCKTCEFNASHEDMKQGLKSGYRECFKLHLNWEDEDFEEDTIFDVWALGSLDQRIQENKIKLSDVQKEDMGGVDHSSEKLTRKARQWLQIEKSKNNDTTYYLDKKNLQKEMNTWKHPLHFIDFETTQPAIPLNKGMTPYEGIAFQFSHHVVHKDGTVEHKNEFLHTEIGVNPNYDFVRHLKAALENDQGTIFRYSHHENTYLNKIYDQLTSDSSYIEDREELCAFILDITSKGGKPTGTRNMVDLCKLVTDYYYDPYMKGSNSIKSVLPAILNSSDFIKEKYSKPIYGAENGIKSQNFTDWTWIEYDGEQVKDPYQLLPKLFTDLSDEERAHIEIHEDMNNGGAAMTAYERLQYEQIPPHIQQEVEKGMLQYCELDTLAMVMIYEAWKDMLKED